VRRGLSLLELLITVVLVGVGVFALYSLFYSIEFKGERMKSRFVMLKLAEGKLEELQYGISDSDLPSSLPTQVVFSGLEFNLARLPSYLFPSLHESSYNGVSYSCAVDLSSPSTGVVMIRVRVWESARPNRFVELVGARLR